MDQDKASRPSHRRELTKISNKKCKKTKIKTKRSKRIQRSQRFIYVNTNKERFQKEDDDKECDEQKRQEGPDAVYGRLE